jgi:hypothetical protein
LLPSYSDSQIDYLIDGYLARKVVFIIIGYSHFQSFTKYPLFQSIKKLKGIVLQELKINFNSALEWKCIWLPFV